MQTYRFSCTAGIVVIIAALIAVSCATQISGRSTNSAALRKTAIAGDIRVAVSRRGYSPSEIKIKKGEPVKIAFFREDDQNCGGQVLIPSLKIVKDLPPGETTIVEFTPQETGELVFTCGMGMFRGKIIVE